MTLCLKMVSFTPILTPSYPLLAQNGSNIWIFGKQMAPINFSCQLSYMIAFARFHGHLLGDGQFYRILIPVLPPAGPKWVKYLNILKTDGTKKILMSIIIYDRICTFSWPFVRRWAVLPHFNPRLSPCWPKMGQIFEYSENRWNHWISHVNYHIWPYLHVFMTLC